MANAMISDNAKSLALQAILYFLMARNAGKTRYEAICEFSGSPSSLAFGKDLTVANVYGLAEAAGYER